MDVHSSVIDEMHEQLDFRYRPDKNVTFNLTSYH
jgi:hypothetical protein